MYNAERIADAITGVLEGTLGSGVVVTVGTFRRGVFEAQADSAKQAHTLRTSTAPNWFDVRLKRAVSSDDSEARMGSTHLIVVEVSIPVWRHMPATVLTADRLAAKSAFVSDLDTAARALSWVDNLRLAPGSLATGVIGGMSGASRGPRPRVTAVTEDAGASLLRAEIQGAITVAVTS